jgi:curli biogenesis system outer membrane secretion channel CsgG
MDVDETTEVPRCDRLLGTISLVEERSAAGTAEGIPPGLAALVRMAEMQNGGGARVDPLPLLKLLVAQSGCFQVVDRGERFDARHRERQLAAGGAVANANNQATLRAADYLLQAKVLYSCSDSGGNGGGLGSMFPGGLGFKQKVEASQIILTLVDVKTGMQQAVATGSAREKDLSIVGRGILTNAGVGALGGTYTSTDIYKITSRCSMRKKTMDARDCVALPAPAPTFPEREWRAR